MALVAFGVGILIGRGSIESPSAKEPPSSNGAVDSNQDTGPTRTAGGVPVGYAPTESGAIQAAINFTRALGAPPSRAEFQEVVDVIAADEWRDEAADDVAAYEAVEGWVAPVAYNVLASDETSADISLWVVGLVESEQGSFQELWLRSSLRLIWEDNDWRVAANEIEPGPWPIPTGRSRPDEFGDVMSNYTPIRYEPASQP